MKKVVCKMATCMSVVLLIFSIYSCGNDDEDSVGSRKLLIGIWNGVSYVDQEWEDGEQIANNKEDFVNGTNRYSIEFKEDGTFIERDRDLNGVVDTTDDITGTWSYSGNKLTLDENDEDEAETWTVTKMTETELVFEQRNKIKEDGTVWEYYEQFSFTK